MSLSLQQVSQIIEEIAPKAWAEEWDNVGILLGSPSKKVSKILLCLDVTHEVADFAIKNQFDLVLSHHPFIFKPLKAVREDLAQGSLLSKLIKADIAVYCAHTNWDNSPLGTSRQLAQALGWTHTEVLKVKGHTKLYKLAVHVPVSHKQQVFAALAKAGAGHIGNYSHCSFSSIGQGTFKPLQNSAPYIGSHGELAQVEEAKLEMIVPETMLNRAKAVACKAHPYEEVALDIIELKNEGEAYGLGLLCSLPYVQSFAEFKQQIAQVFPRARRCGDVNSVHKVAVCGGSGADLLHIAKARGADVLITGDVNYHAALDAANLGIAIIDAGHYETEAYILPQWKKMLCNDFEVDIFKTSSEPFSALAD